jgi:hypothetical protein
MSKDDIFIIESKQYILLFFQLLALIIIIFLTHYAIFPFDDGFHIILTLHFILFLLIDKTQKFTISFELTSTALTIFEKIQLFILDEEMLEMFQ